MEELKDILGKPVELMLVNSAGRVVFLAKRDCDGFFSTSEFMKGPKRKRGMVQKVFATAPIMLAEAADVFRRNPSAIVAGSQSGMFSRHMQQLFPGDYWNESGTISSCIRVYGGQVITFLRLKVRYNKKRKRVSR